NRIIIGNNCCFHHRLFPSPAVFDLFHIGSANPCLFQNYSLSPLGNSLHKLEQKAYFALA
ncbi:MAG TPA: hypothetical protein DG577_04930, partial [Firmicutes bacterium]|nr:hypothetical protein [Bacillota bacterium]